MGLLDGKVAIITGAGNGIGKSHALLFAKEGASVVVNDLGGARDGSGADASPAEAVVQEIVRAGGRAVASHDSVATAEGAQAIVGKAVSAFGRADVLVNNAGILRDKTFLKLDEAMFDAVVAVHLKGTFLCSQAFAKQAVQQGEGGRIVNTTSVSGMLGNFGQANYAAAKMGLVGLSSVFAIEGAKYDIKSNVIAPVARTRLTEGLMSSMGEAANVFDPAYIAPLVGYLCSEECEYSHDVFNVGAGRYARIFVGSAPGWNSPAGKPPTVEEIRDNRAKIHSTEGFKVPYQAIDA